METKHTPGPWINAGGDNSSIEINIGETTSSVSSYDKNTSLHVIGRGEMEANAKLISAAPDLLDALIECSKSICNHADGGLPEYTEAFDKAMLAINKATL